jgi:hypothetical protein
MSGATIARGAAAAVVLVGLVGTVDALFEESHDHALLFGALTVCGLVGLVSAGSLRRAVPLRADLARWLRERGELSGESPAAIAGRAVAAYRDGLTVGSDDPLAGGPGEEVSTTGDGAGHGSPMRERAS